MRVLAPWSGLPRGAALWYATDMNASDGVKHHRIGEAARELGVKPSVLRFWEGEFPQLRPVRTDSGQRLYTSEHMELLRRIRALLYDEGLTIEGARKRLDEASDPLTADTVLGRRATPEQELLREVADELRSLLRIISGPGGSSPDQP